MEQTILVVDDEREIADLVEVYLKNEGFPVLKAYTAAEALEIIAQKELSLAILDVMLPDMDGFTLCQKIRESHLYPILMLSAKVEDMDKIMGLTLGADDYITKPFSPLELVARVRPSCAGTHAITPQTPESRSGMNTTSAACSSVRIATSVPSTEKTSPSPPLSLTFSGISVSTVGKSSPRKSCLKQSGKKNTWMETIRSWHTSPACGRK